MQPSAEAAGPTNNYFLPFARETVTLFNGSSNSGKSTAVRKIIENADLYFETQIRRVVVLHSHHPSEEDYILHPNNRCPWPQPDIQHHLLEEFDVENLEEDDLLILEDLQQVTQAVSVILNTHTHHKKLLGTILINHSILGSTHYQLLNLVHRIVLFLSSVAVVNAGDYIISRFFKNPDIKTYLKSILAFGQEHKETLLLEFVSHPDKKKKVFHLAVTHLLSLTNVALPFAVVFPYPETVHKYTKLTDQRVPLALLPSVADAEKEEEHQIEYEDNEEEENCVTKQLFEKEKFKVYNLMDSMPDRGFLFLSKQNVLTLSREEAKVAREAAESGASAAGGPEARCLDEEKIWNEAALSIEKEVEKSFPVQKWLKCKNLLRYMLSNPEFCFSSDCKRVSLKNSATSESNNSDSDSTDSSENSSEEDEGKASKWKNSVVIIDFLGVAIRRSAPNEIEGGKIDYKLYRKFANSLLKHNTPLSYFPNQLLLVHSSTSAAAQRKKISLGRRRYIHRIRRSHCSDCDRRSAGTPRRRRRKPLKQRRKENNYGDDFPLSATFHRPPHPTTLREKEEEEITFENLAQQP